MEKISLQLKKLQSGITTVINGVKNFGRNAEYDWVAIFSVSLIISIIGIIFAVYEYRLAVSRYVNFIPQQTASSTRDFDISKAQRASDAFIQKEIHTQDIIRGKEDIREMP